MAYFSFFLLKDSFSYLSKQVEIKQKYYSKDITLWKHLNNRNKQKDFCVLKREIRFKTNVIGKKLLICLPPKFGLGDAVEYSIAINSLLKSKKFSKIGIAYCGDHTHIFKDLFLFSNLYPIFISEKEIREYDTIFHITLDIKALKFQKYFRSNIAVEICNYFKVKIVDVKIYNNTKIKNQKSIITIFPVATSAIRSIPFKIIEELILNFKQKYKFKIIIDESPFSKYLMKKIVQKNNFEFLKPRNVEALIKEISKVDFGIFVDSGPLHIAKIFDKPGILIETSVSGEILLNNSNKIHLLKNKYISNYCKGPCGLVDIFSYNNNIGCYETNQISFSKLRDIENLKNLQRFNKKENNTQFMLNPVGCIKKIDVNNIIELVKRKIKEK